MVSVCFFVIFIGYNISDASAYTVFGSSIKIENAETGYLAGTGNGTYATGKLDGVPYSVSNAPPAAGFTYQPTDTIRVGDTVTFQNSSTDPDNNIKSYSWDFNGDGTVDSQDKNPSWTPADYGEFRVTLTVMDSDNAMDTITKVVKVYPAVKDVTPVRITDDNVDDAEPSWGGSDLYWLKWDAGRQNNKVMDYHNGTGNTYVNSSSTLSNSELRVNEEPVYIGISSGDALERVYVNGSYKNSNSATSNYIYRNPSYDPINQQVAYVIGQEASHVLGIGDDIIKLDGFADIAFPRIRGNSVYFAGKKIGKSTFGIYKYSWKKGDSDTTGTVAVIEDRGFNCGASGKLAGRDTLLGFAASDDGSIIAWRTEQFPIEAEYYDTSTNSIRVLTEKGIEKGEPVVTPDGRYILTNSTLTDVADNKEYSIYGGSFTGGEYVHSLDTDGRYAVFTEAQRVYIYDRELNQYEMVWDDGEEQRHPTIGAGGIAWQQFDGNDWEIYKSPIPGFLVPEQTDGKDLSNYKTGSVGNAENAEISENGRYIVWFGEIEGRSPEVYLYDSQTNQTQQITHDGYNKLTISSGGPNTLFVSENTKVIVWEETINNKSVTCIYHIDSGQITKLNGDQLPLKLSEDGTRIYLYSASEQDIYNINNGNAMKLDHYPIALSSNLKYMVYGDVNGENLEDIPGGNSELINQNLSFGLTDLSDVYVSDDGNIVTIAGAKNSQVGSEEIYLYNHTTKKFTNLTNNDKDDGALSMSNDGKNLYWFRVQNTQTSKLDLYHYNTETGDSERVDTLHEALSFIKSYHETSVSADGNRFTYQKNRPDNGTYTVSDDIFYYDNQSKKVNPVTSDILPEQTPVISADGLDIVWKGSTGTGSQATFDIWGYNTGNKSATPVEQQNTGLPVSFKLNGNYPNPFNPSTKISFRLPEKADVTLQVYNVLGQLVQTLHKGLMPAGNQNEIYFSARGLASGVYFYKIIAKSNNHKYMASDKFLLLK